MPTHRTFCRICEALCGLEVETEADRVVQIRPDDEHIATRGFACVKGLKQNELYDSPDRLQYPLAKVGDRHERVSWEEALAGIGERVKGILAHRSPDAVAMYVGTAAGFGVLHPVFAQGFMQGIGSRSMFSSATQDCANKFAVSHHVYGFPFTLPFPDVDRTECLIVVGANPAVSKWSFLQVSNPIQRLKEIEARGAKLYFVDPRRTESAKVAGQHVFIRPGTDVFFYLSFLHELICQRGIDSERIRSFMRGFDDVANLASRWPAERTAPVTQIAPETLREMVSAYVQANGAALYCSTGVNMGGNGALAFWIQEVINAVSGNLDRAGGSMVGLGVMDFPAFAKKNGVLVRPDKSRIGDFTSVNDAFPGGILADEILTPGDEQIRALFVTGGNPLMTMANSGRLRKAFEELELLVVLDIFPTETAQVADFVLPCTSPLQRPDLPFIFPLMLGLQSRPYLQATRAVVPPSGQQRDEASIYLDLARACGVSIFGSKVVQTSFELMKEMSSALSSEPESRGDALPQELLLSGLLRLTGQGGFKKLLRAEHGRPREEHEPGSFLGKRVLTEDGRVDLAPEVFLKRARDLDGIFRLELESQHRFKLISKRQVKTHNSWTHNLESFVSGAGYTNHLYMHPEDASDIGVTDDDVVDVSSATGMVRVPIRLTEDLMKGTVALPHGWGHQDAKGLSVASQTEGVNVNLLAADGPDALEPVSGMAHLTGIPVEIVPARGPRAPTWSGTPA